MLQIVIAIVSLAFLSVGIYGAVYLEQEFDPNVFIPKDSYLKEYFDTYQQNFPDVGADSGHIYLGKHHFAFHSF